MPAQISLYCWLGDTDLDASKGSIVDVGPIASALLSGEFQRVVLLHTRDPEVYAKYSKWLTGRVRDKFSGSVVGKWVDIKGSTDGPSIYDALKAILEGEEAELPDGKMVFHLNPGTAVMVILLAIFGSTRFRARLIQTDENQAGVLRDVEIPFSMSADMQNERIAKSVSLSRAAPSSTFKDIVYRGDEMRRVLMRAQQFSMIAVPLLIVGEQGTGRRALAECIHQAHLHDSSKRGSFHIVDCGADPYQSLAELLFPKNPETHTPKIEGTIYLNEVQRLTTEQQLEWEKTLDQKTLVVSVPHPRARNQKLISHSVNVKNARFIASASPDIHDLVRAGKFSEKLFLMLSAGLIKVPPLSRRRNDIIPIAEVLLLRFKKQNPDFVKTRDFTLTKEAEHRLLDHDWPGNIRQLNALLSRACILMRPDETRVTREILDEASNDFAAIRTVASEGLLPPLTVGFNLAEVVKNIEKRYYALAHVACGGRKTRMAELLGMKASTLQKRLEKND